MTDTAEPIAIAPFAGRVGGQAGGTRIADSAHALLLRETGHDDVFYLPRADARMERLEPSDRRSHCPRKGDAVYFHVAMDGRRVPDAAWSYPDPVPGARAIAGYLAFYPDKVEIEAVPLG